MSKTLVKQLQQLANSETFNDDLASGSLLQSNSTNLESDLNALRSQLKRILWAESTGSWYDGIVTPSGESSPVGLNDLIVNLFSTKNKFFLKREINLNVVNVATGSNFAQLSSSLGTAPESPMALNGFETTGSVTYKLESGSYGSFNLGLISGSNNESIPKNLLLIRDAWTGAHVTISGNRDVYGLLQVENSATNGDSFNNLNRRSQISFVIQTTVNGTSSFISAPTSSIGGRSINYAYAQRKSLSTLDEDSFTTDISFFDFGAVAGSNSASETNEGIAELATQTETNLGIDDLRIVTPLKLRVATGPNRIDYVQGFVGDAVTAGNRRGYTRGSDPTSALTEFTAVVVFNAYYFRTGADFPVFGIQSSAVSGAGWNIRFNGQAITSRYRTATGGELSIGNDDSRYQNKWIVAHLRIFRTSGTTTNMELYVNGARIGATSAVSTAGHIADANLCVGVYNEGVNAEEFDGRVHGAAYAVTAMSREEISAHSDACTTAGQLVQASSGTQLADGWRASVDALEPDATDWQSFLAGTALSTINTTALTLATKAPPVIYA